MTASSSQDDISKHLAGDLTSQFIALECPHCSSQLHGYISLPLAVCLCVATPSSTMIRKPGCLKCGATPSGVSPEKSNFTVQQLAYLGLMGTATCRRCSCEPEERAELVKLDACEDQLAWVSGKPPTFSRDTRPEVFVLRRPVEGEAERPLVSTPPSSNALASQPPPDITDEASSECLLGFLLSHAVVSRLCWAGAET